ncbi:quinate repressor [Stachybotrys elegans]|uniref:Quinate repressor n=1 Tax=Stachybotrys elegans TaxID=80388 RepID=A0A8K0WXC2_9HYPO|nr:quinate repressor [Stachybotrys elegans]
MAGVKRSLGDMLGHSIAAIDETPPLTPKALDSNSAFTTRSPSPNCPPLPDHVPTFAPDASIVFVGVRGAGKSTLAIMASATLKRNIIDMESAFQRDTGMSSPSYRKLNGTLQCHRQQARVLQTTLEHNRTNTIIVCSWMDRRAQHALREFAATNPVVHILRSPEAIQQHLKLQDPAKVRDLVDISSAIFRTCSNFEFFNVTETASEFPVSSAADAGANRAAPYLTLKQVERHLRKFLSLIYPPGAIPLIESVFPLAAVPLEDRLFTYALELPLSSITRGGIDIEEKIVGVDAVQVTVTPSIPVPTEKGLVDCYFELATDITKGIGVVRRSAVIPIILHLHLPHAADEETRRLYLDLLAHALRLAPEIVTIDLNLPDQELARVCKGRRRSRIIGTYEASEDAPSWSSDIWLHMYRKACRLDCDMVRLLRPALCFQDNLDVSRFRSTTASLPEARIPVIAYNTGALGRHSACMNPILTLTAVESGQETPTDLALHSQLTAIEATKALSVSFAYDPMKLYVFGVKVGYSASPIMHNKAIEACGLPHCYRAHSTNSLSAIRHLIEDTNFGGASVGLPYKVEAIALTHSLSRHARAIGAVNTLIPVRQLNPDGSIPEGAAFFNSVNRAGPVKALFGENTDWVGIRACIRRGLSPANAVRSATCGLIVGAGGMARAAVYAMLQVGVRNIVIYNRTLENAEKLVSHFTKLLKNPESQFLGGGKDTRFHIIKSLDGSWPSSFRAPTIIISCIPTHGIGDIPAPDFTAPDEWLQSHTGGVIIELGYKNLHTPLLQQVRARAAQGWVALDGIDLLPEQGFAQFEMFTGRRAPRRVMRRALLTGYQDEQGRSNLIELQQRLSWMYEQDA